MGTRNLTMIRLNKELKVAEYGQYDGYPTGAGAAIAHFIQTNLMDPICAAAFAKQVAALKFATYTDADRESIDFRGPEGAKILDIILAGIPDNLVGDDREFFENGLFCEWAYLIDLDAQKVEVYRWGKKLATKISFKKFTVAAMAALQERLSA